MIIESPIVLHGSIAVLSAGQQLALANDGGLKHVADVPIEVSEIRFAFTPSRATTVFNMGLFVDLGIGGYPITDGMVSLPLICPPKDSQDEVGPDSVVRHTLKLDEPMLVLPNETLRCSFWNNGAAVGADTLGVSAQMVGRRLPPGAPRPKRRVLPWFSDYVGAQQFGAVTIATQSNDVDLRNPTDQPLFVDKILARLGYNSSGAAAAAGADLYSNAKTASDLTLAMSGVTVRMADSFGNPVIRDKTPFAMAFPWQERSWRVRTWMPPRGYFIAYIEGSNTSGTVQPFIGLAGRQVVSV